MITAVHALFYTNDPEGARAFFRDKLRLPHFDATPGWPLFHVPAGIVACHPGADAAHGIAFACDDIKATVTDLQSRGVRFLGPIVEEDWGWIVECEVPGSMPAQIYQAKYSRP